MLFRSNTKKKRRNKNKKKKIFDFVNFPILFLTIISLFFISSFFYEILFNQSKNTKQINLQEILDASKNRYEKETGHRIQVEVLNGCGQIYMAVMYQNFLRDEGFDVMNAKNADSFDFDFSKIILHKDNMEMALFLSEIMGINDSLIIKDLDQSLMIDLSIVIGKDFKELDSYDKAAIHYPIF